MNGKIKNEPTQYPLLKVAYASDYQQVDKIVQIRKLNDFDTTFGKEIPANRLVS